MALVGFRIKISITSHAELVKTQSCCCAGMLAAAMTEPCVLNDALHVSVAHAQDTVLWKTCARLLAHDSTVGFGLALASFMLWQCPVMGVAKLYAGYVASWAVSWFCQWAAAHVCKAWCFSAGTGFEPQQTWSVRVWMWVCVWGSRVSVISCL